jgi:hypothetical protein
MMWFLEWLLTHPDRLPAKPSDLAAKAKDAAVSLLAFILQRDAKCAARKWDAGAGLIISGTFDILVSAHLRCDLW